VPFLGVVKKNGIIEYKDDNLQYVRLFLRDQGLEPVKAHWEGKDSEGHPLIGSISFHDNQWYGTVRRRS